MAGYERQSLASIQPGQDVAAGPVNDEFNQLEDAFDGSTGHSHDGSTGNAPKISLTTSVSGILPVENGGTGGKNNVSGSDPTVSDDSSQDYAAGSLWTNTNTDFTFICFDAGVGAAIWGKLPREISSAITPEVDNTTDIGSVALKFKDLHVYTVNTVTANVTTLNATNIAAFTSIGTINMDGNKITGLPLPTVNADAATKQYADSLSFSSALPGIGPGTAGQFVTNDGAIAFWDDVVVDDNIWFAKFGF